MLKCFKPGNESDKTVGENFVFQLRNVCTLSQRKGTETWKGNRKGNQKIK